MQEPEQENEQVAQEVQEVVQDAQEVVQDAQEVAQEVAREEVQEELTYEMEALNKFCKRSFLIPPIYNFFETNEPILKSLCVLEIMTYRMSAKGTNDLDSKTKAASEMFKFFDKKYPELLYGSTNEFIPSNIIADLADLCNERGYPEPVYKMRRYKYIYHVNCRVGRIVRYAISYTTELAKMKCAYLIHYAIKHNVERVNSEEDDAMTAEGPSRTQQAQQAQRAQEAQQRPHGYEGHADQPELMDG